MMGKARGKEEEDRRTYYLFIRVISCQITQFPDKCHMSVSDLTEKIPKNTSMYSNNKNVNSYLTLCNIFGDATWCPVCNS